MTLSKYFDVTTPSVHVRPLFLGKVRLQRPGRWRRKGWSAVHWYSTRSPYFSRRPFHYLPRVTGMYGATAGNAAADTYARGRGDSPPSSCAAGALVRESWGAACRQTPSFSTNLIVAPCFLIFTLQVDHGRDHSCHSRCVCSFQNRRAVHQAGRSGGGGGAGFRSDLWRTGEIEQRCAVPTGSGVRRDPMLFLPGRDIKHQLLYSQ